MKVRLWLVLAVLGSGAACELREITIAEPEDVIVAEVVLRAGASLQTALLHRTATRGGTVHVPGADVIVREESTGRTFRLEADADSLCVSPPPAPGSPAAGTCYTAWAPAAAVLPGTRYSLRIELPDSRVLTGYTTVPAAFDLVSPVASQCRLPADTRFELVWTQAAGASVYVVETRLFGLQASLRDRGVPIAGNEPVDLTGLAIGGADTTLVVPSELGLFDRFSDDVHPILLAIRDGLPERVSMEVVVAAAERNYVNWVRGGNFNPSGLVRVSSLRGDGIGVFGALVLRAVDIETPPASLPDC